VAGLQLRRYGLGARWYDVLSGERWVYRAGRVAGIEQLRLSTGDRVLDVGCGTGLNFPILLDAVGATGTVVGVDASPAMLAMARARIADLARPHVSVIDGDAGRLPDLVGDQTYDAALFTFSLSIIDDWQTALRGALATVRPGGRVDIVDMALPTGRWKVLAPLARLACLTGGADPHRHPWQALSEVADDVTGTVLRGGHIHACTGTRRPTEAA